MGFRKPVTIGVAGGTGSGKTTVATQIVERVGSKHMAILAHDSYYKAFSHLTEAERHTINFDHPDSLDTPLLIEHVKQLQQGLTVQVPEYDFARYSRKTETAPLVPQPIIMVEGILIFVERELRELMDIKIFVDTDADIRFIRRLRRDIAERGRTVETVIEQYLATVRPMHLRFVEPTRRYADVIVPEGGFNTVAVDMIADRIRSMLARQIEEASD